MSLGLPSSDIEKAITTPWPWSNGEGISIVPQDSYYREGAEGRGAGFLYSPWIYIIL